MKRSGLPKSPRIDPIVEEKRNRCSPVPANRVRFFPAFGLLHGVRCKVESVDLRFGKVVPPSHVTLSFGFWEAWERIDEVLLPGPGNDCTQMVASFVGSATWICAFIRNCSLVDPVQKFSHFSAPKLLDGHTISPSRPFFERRTVLASGCRSTLVHSEVLSDYGSKCRWHEWTFYATDLLLPCLSLGPATPVVQSC